MILLFLLSTSVLYGSDLSIKINGDYFLPSEKIFKEIYGNGFIYGGELDYSIFKNINICLELKYFSAKGVTTFSKDETKVTIMPILLSGRYDFFKKGISPFISIGIGYYVFNERNIIGSTKDNKIGFFIQSGIKIRVTNKMYLDFHLGYTHCEIRPVELSCNIGGLNMGIGAAYQF